MLDAHQEAQTGMQCDRCAGEAFTRAGRDRLGRQLWRYQACGRRLTARSASAFSGYRFPDEIIAFKIGGRWRYAFRAIDEHGQIVDVLFSDHRDAASARAFFEQALPSTKVAPTRVITDKATCHLSALRTALPGVKHRSAH
jgi:transposase-like protein